MALILGRYWALAAHHYSAPEVFDAEADDTSGGALELLHLRLAQAALH
jgi:hypothetical protein